jgi:fructose-1,6-bisphosphatase/inositol monophosphatase family enzyme
MKFDPSNAGTADRELLSGLIARACTEAGEYLARTYHRLGNAGVKASGHDEIRTVVKDETDQRTVVTEADLKAEEIIVRIIGTALHCSFLSEEGAAGLSDIQSDFRAVIDPLDGTRNFVDQVLGLFGISVAIERTGTLAAGGIHLPLSGDLLVADEDEGILWARSTRGHKLSLRKLAVRRLPVTTISQARLVIGRGAGPSGDLVEAPLRNIIKSCGEALNYGSCSVALLNVAMGRIDGVVLPCQRYWDFAAGIALSKHLPSRLRAFRHPWRQVASESELTRATRDDLFDIVVATNDQLLEELLALLAER